MRRIHLFEFEDQEWFPGFLRDYMTDFLQFLSNKAKVYKPIIPLLAEKIRKSGENEVLDLASGGGGGLLWLNEELKKEIPHVKITLTDYYPNLSAFEQTKKVADNFYSVDYPVDARKVPDHLKGFRTQFLSFHHFKPDDARQILANAVESNSCIAVFEAQGRNVPSVLAMLFSPLSVLFTTPFIRPFKWGRILFTYLIPVVPLCVLWDGVVSSFRTYSVKEMQEMVSEVDPANQYNWDIGMIRKGGGLFYLIGLPKNK